MGKDNPLLIASIIFSLICLYLVLANYCDRRHLQHLSKHQIAAFEKGDFSLARSYGEVMNNALQATHDAPGQ